MNPMRRLVSRRYSSEVKERAPRYFSWKAVMLMGGLFGVSAVYYHKKRLMIQKQMMGDFKSVGEQQIGGTFNLVNHHNVPVNSYSYLGRYLLLYFGFTYCPDICPAELHKVSMAMNILKEEYGYDENDIVPMFISVDPWRDSIGKIRVYMNDFHPSMIGLTGTPNQIKEMCKNYRVYNSSTKGSDYIDEEDDDYLVDHSTVKYFVGPDGKYISIFGTDLDARELADQIAVHLQKAGSQGAPTLATSLKLTYRRIVDTFFF